MRRAAGLAVAAFAALGMLALAAATARAHVVYGTATLHRLVARADAVARVRITDAERSWSLEEGGASRPVVVAEVLEVLKAPPAAADAPALRPGGALRFAPHGHGTARYADGEEALVFLRASAGHRELGALDALEGVPWVSVQEHDDKVALTGAEGSALLEAARRYAALADLPEPEARREAFRRATLAALASPVPRLAIWAAMDLALAGDAPLVGPEDVPVLDALLASPDTPVAVRIALLTVLEERTLVDAPPRWAALLRATSGDQRVAVARAARVHPSPAVTAALLEVLAQGPPGEARAAALGLGVPGNDAAVPALASALAADDAGLRGAAVRALGAVATDAAREALARAAEAHPRPATRRRAAAELQLLEARGRPEAPGPTAAAP